ncbi:polyprenyl synthetase family protein [Methanolobus mangrovi]|uniref:Polyprenyl synthetase family protein n=1 Tax=Methanolobus mangrovi TaxID=3072977 RepID=A0AA51UFN9_9EURY|nr:polyprenyl synthetase family protein [Methanolobus mangrovi]WMW22285.1 polyprenyl synthetase family protein [Methanolobus mangrovi]
MIQIDDLEEYQLIRTTKDEIIHSMDDHSLMKKMLLHICSSGGKNIRPVMLVLCTEMCGGNPENSINAALAIEFIHSASLIHDDVLDGGLVRRGVESAHKKYGIPAAILCGDFLISKAISLISGYGNNAVNEFGRAGMYMAEGETIDISSVCEEFREKNYFECISKKTGSLFAASAAIGAYVAGADEETALKLRSFGENVGNAYQIVDDLLEYLDELEDKSSTYESVTLPLIYMRVMDHDAAVEKTLQQVRDCVQNAKEILASFPSSEARDKLELVTDLITVDMLPGDLI